MSNYTGVRYTALNPAALDKDGKLSPLSKLFATLKNENGTIDYNRIDKLAQGRRISEFKPSDTNWFLSTFQCVNCLLGGGDTITTIGELAESMPNEHFAQFPVSLERVSKILIDPQMGLLRRWVLNEDISVAFVADPGTDLESFIDPKTRLVSVVSRGGVMTSGRHRLTSIMTFLEYGLGIPYSVYKNQRIRIRAYRFDNAVRVVEAVQAANFTRTMSPAETKNIQSQLVHGVGSTSSIEKQIEVFTKPKSKSAEQKLAFANSFRIRTEGDNITDLTRFNIGVKLYDELFGKTVDKFGQKYSTPRIDPKQVNAAGLYQIIETAASEYQNALKGIGNIARDGVRPAVEYVTKLICKQKKLNYDKPIGAPFIVDGEIPKKVVAPKPVETVQEPETKQVTSRRRLRNTESAPEPKTVEVEIVPESVSPKVTPIGTRRRRTVQ